MPTAVTAIGAHLKLTTATPEQQRRIAFAGWLADPANPLPARVLVNRLWQHQFGEGLVNTPNDFGRNGAKPSNPELLDWLAAEFIRSGWSIKHMQKLIVTSRAWKQSSAPSEKGMAVDAQTRMLWRYPPRRVDAEALRELGLLTNKPIIYVFNVDEGVLTEPGRKQALADLIAPAQAIFLDAKTESELQDLDVDEARELLASMGQEESGLDQLARIGFDALGLQTFLTAGPKESRAWTIHKGWTAPEAAGVIHTDFQKGFIKAEIVSFDDLVKAGSVAEARAHGWVRMEGKDYVMQDGDVVEFRFSN